MFNQRLIAKSNQGHAPIIIIMFYSIEGPVLSTVSIVHACPLERHGLQIEACSFRIPSCRSWVCHYIIIALSSIVPKLLPSFLSNTVLKYDCDKKLGRSLAGNEAIGLSLIKYVVCVCTAIDRELDICEHVGILTYNYMHRYNDA